MDMAEILLGRHAESEANKRNFAAFGNIESPLTSKGVLQCEVMRTEFVNDHAIDPLEYDLPVLASSYERPYETAQRVGFRNIHRSSAINESDVDEEILVGINVIKKHKEELWVADEVSQRARSFIERVRDGELDYRVYFAHGLSIAAVLMELSKESDDIERKFLHAKRGYIPLQASITPVTV